MLLKWTLENLRLPTAPDNEPVLEVQKTTTTPTINIQTKLPCQLCFRFQWESLPLLLLLHATCLRWLENAATYRIKGQATAAGAMTWLFKNCRAAQESKVCAVYSCFILFLFFSRVCLTSPKLLNSFAMQLSDVWPVIDFGFANIRLAFRGVCCRGRVMLMTTGDGQGERGKRVATAFHTN